MSTPGNDVTEHAEDPITDDNFRKNEEDGNLLDKGEGNTSKSTYYINAVSKETTKEVVVGYKEVIQIRDTNRDVTIAAGGVMKTLKTWQQTEVDEFHKTTKSTVSLMVKEFELKKHAFQFTRATTATRGVLDVNKIHQYKYDDNIFKAVTSLADAKSHGMVMFIDFSGSMGGILKNVLKQTLIMTAFCKRVGIPFDVYTFCSKAHKARADEVKATMKDFDVDCSYSVVRQILSSKMTKVEYNRCVDDLLIMAIDGMYGATTRYNYTRDDCELGGTPLVETAMMARHILREFKTKNAVQKVTAIFLTDGDGISPHHYMDRSINPSLRADATYAGTYHKASDCRIQINMDGKHLNYANSRDMAFKCQSDVLNYLRAEFNVVGYFIADRRSTYNYKLEGIRLKNDVNMKKTPLNKSYSKMKYVSIDGVEGYDRLFLIDGGALDTTATEFEVKDKASIGEVRTAFKKHAGGKKSKRLFAAEFIEMVA
jgi:hypothetical protein